MALAGALVDRDVIVPLEPGVAADVLDPGHELLVKLTDQGRHALSEAGYFSNDLLVA